MKTDEWLHRPLLGFPKKKKTNIEIDRKILANLALNEPYSFKCVVDEVRLQSNMMETMTRRPVI